MNPTQKARTEVKSSCHVALKSDSDKDTRENFIDYEIVIRRTVAGRDIHLKLLK